MIQDTEKVETSGREWDDIFTCCILFRIAILDRTEVNLVTVEGEQYVSNLTLECQHILKHLGRYFRE